MRTTVEWLASEESGGAFRHCIRCKLPLLEVTAQWLVNKEFHRGECVLEYAICKPCRDRVTEDFSEESKEAMRLHLENHIDWEARLMEFMAHGGLDARMEACIACRTPRESLEGFGICAVYDSEGHLQEGALPLLICTKCIAAASENLSQATREAWERFLSRHFEGPPADRETLPGSGLSGLI